MRLSDRLLPWAGAALAGLPLLTAAPASAQAPRDCFTAAMPRVVIDRQTVPVALDTQRTIAALSAEVKGTRAARALGRAEVEHRLVIEPSFELDPRNGSYCAVPTEVRLLVHDRRRTIFVAREVTGDACLNREVLAHEQRHIRASEQVIDAAIADAEAGLRTTLRRRPMMPQATAEAAAAATRAVVVAWFEALRDRIDRETERRNAEIDSPVEYRRVSTACGRGAAALVAVDASPRVIATADRPSPDRAPAPPPGRPLTPAPPAPESPVFRDAVETLDGELVVRLQPVPERAVVTVTTPAGAPQAREITELRLTVARQGNDLVQIRRSVMAARGLARWFPDRVTTDALGTLKDIGETAVSGPAPNPVPGPVGDAADPLQVFARELAPRLARALAEIEQPRFPVRGVRPGDVINQAAGDDGVVRYDSRMVVRGVATVGGRPVLVVDHAFSIATLGPSLTSRGYRLLDLETGSPRYADANQVTATTRAGQTTLQRARVITSVVEAAATR